MELFFMASRSTSRSLSQVTTTLWWQRRPCTHSVLPKNTSTCRLYWAVIEPQTFRSIDEHTPFGPQSEIRLNIFLSALKGDSHTYSMSRPFSESFPFFTSTSVASFNINGMYCKHLKMFTVHASSANMKLEFIALPRAPAIPSGIILAPRSTDFIYLVCMKPVP